MATELFMLRHGEASPYASSDAARELTDSGRLATSRVLASRLDELSAVTAILASPLVRAQQTAEIAAESLGTSVKTCDWLTPEAGVQGLVSQLECISSPVLLVTHQPLVGDTLDWLLAAERGRYFFDTSSLAKVSYDVCESGCAELEWMQHAPRVEL